MKDIVLAVDIKNKKIGNFRLENIRFSLEKGYIMGLAGRMGAGKTSLMKCIMNPENAGKDNMVRCAGHVGTIMEEMPFLNDAALKENAELYGNLYAEYSYERFNDYLTRTGLEEHKIYGHLSKGERIKFQFAFAMSHKPSLLILDEPTSGLDAVFRREFLYMLQEAVEKEMISVIISTHIMEDLDKVADYIGYMENGSLLFVEEKDALKERYEKEDGTKELPSLSDILLSEKLKEKTAAINAGHMGELPEEKNKHVSLKALNRFNPELSRKSYRRIGAYVLTFFSWLLAVFASVSKDKVLFWTLGGFSVLVLVNYLLSAMQIMGNDKKMHMLKLGEYFPVRKKDGIAGKTVFVMRYALKLLVLIAVQLFIGWLLLTDI